MPTLTAAGARATSPPARARPRRRRARDLAAGLCELGAGLCELGAAATASLLRAIDHAGAPLACAYDQRTVFARLCVLVAFVAHCIAVHVQAAGVR